MAVGILWLESRRFPGGVAEEMDGIEEAAIEKGEGIFRIKYEYSNPKSGSRASPRRSCELKSLYVATQLQDSDNGHVPRASVDVWRKTLDHIPSCFGKLVYLASLRNPNTGRYEHFGLTQLYGADEADQSLRINHERVFADWLNYRLEQQKSDLEAHLGSVGDDRSAVLDAWRSLSPYRSLPPAAAGDAERFLYSSDLEIILELLRTELSS